MCAFINTNPPSRPTGPEHSLWLMVNTPSSDNSFVSLGLCIHFVRQKTCGKDFSIENRSHICKNLYRGVKKPPRRASGELDCNCDATWSVFFYSTVIQNIRKNKPKTFLACLLLLTPGPRNSQSKMQKTFLLHAVYSGCLTPPRCSSACLSSCHGHPNWSCGAWLSCLCWLRPLLLW